MAVVGLATTHPAQELAADACAESLASVHLGRVDKGVHGQTLLEVLVVDL